MTLFGNIPSLRRWMTWSRALFAFGLKVLGLWAMSGAKSRRKALMQRAGRGL